MTLQDKNVLVTGASMGIGRAIALAFAKEGANLVLFARSPDKLATVVDEAQKISQQAGFNIQARSMTVDVRDPKAVKDAVEEAASKLSNGKRAFDILVNNAGLALGAPTPVFKQSLDDINTMIDTNIRGFFLAPIAALNEGGMLSQDHGIILNVTSTTALEVPPFPGEAVYHACKASQEGFTNALRVELSGTNVRVLAIRPGVVAGHFHQQRVGADQTQYDEFMQGFEPLVAEDVGKAAVWMCGQDERLSVKALDVVPSAQRSLSVFDRQWNERHA